MVEGRGTWQVEQHALPPAEIARAVSVLQSHMASGHASEVRHFNRSLRKQYQRSFPLFRVLLSGISSPAARALLERRFLAPVVHHMDLLVKDAHAPATSWHQDRYYWTGFDNPPSMVTFWFALVDTLQANGALLLHPGPTRPVELLTHVDHAHSEGNFQFSLPPEEEARLDPARAVTVEVAAGGFVAFDSFAIHGAHPNDGNTPRFAFKIVVGEAASLGRNRLFSLRSPLLSLGVVGALLLYGGLRLRPLRDALRRKGAVLFKRLAPGH